MKRATFKLEFITPAFLGGACPHEWGELRVASIRGQLRWWFRALGYSAAEEARLFGSVRTDAGNASQVIVRIGELILPDGHSLHNQPGTHEFQPPVDAAAVGGSAINSPEGYLAFNLRQPRNKSPYKRGMIPEKTRFSLHLSSARLNSANFHLVCQVVRLFAMHGSLGTRSRRTFGCMRLMNETGDLPTEPARLEDFLHRRVDWRVLPNGPWVSQAEMRKFAGQWLKEHRNNRSILPKNRRGEVFGHAGEDGPRGENRRASPVILRPFINQNGQYSLGLIISRPLPSLLQRAIQ